jgi:hypothetical protein
MAVQAARARPVDTAVIGFVDDRPPGSHVITQLVRFAVLHQQGLTGAEALAAQRAKILAGPRNSFAGSYRSIERNTRWQP